MSPAGEIDVHDLQDGQLAEQESQAGWVGSAELEMAGHRGHDWGIPAASLGFL